MLKAKKALSVLLVICIIGSSVGITSFAAKDFETRAEEFIGRGLEAFVAVVLNAVSAIIPDGTNFYDIDDYNKDGFMKGSYEFLTEPEEGAQWSLGSSTASLVPDDWQTYDYTLGGYFNFNSKNILYNKVERIYSDMQVRVIAVSDGGGIKVFAVIDSIGMTNKDIRKIRETVKNKAQGRFDFDVINVGTTHSHSGIDTEGLWTKVIRKIFYNLFMALTRLGRLKTGTDPKYMDFLYDTVSDSIIEACENMTEGTMSFTKKDIGEDYFKNKNRPSASSLDTNMNRFIFTPFDENEKPTMIVNIAAHPDVAGMATTDDDNKFIGVDSGRVLSGEYPYHMGEIINGAGYNFMFMNGAIAGIYMETDDAENHQPINERPDRSKRYGEELGKIALSLTLTEQQIIDDEYLSNDEVEAKEKAIAEASGENVKYRIWYEGWEPSEERELEPILNIALREVDIPVTNAFIQIAGKLNLASYDVLKKGLKYYIRTEIGYMEFGDVKMVLMPGEICQDLVYGGASLKAETSVANRDFDGKTIFEIFGEDTIALGLMNDAIGYVLPDNDYIFSLFLPEFSAEEFEDFFNGNSHYQEMISLGRYAGSTLMAAYEELANEIVR